MNGSRRWLVAVPPLLAGLAAAVALEVSTGLLLYTDEGLLPALTLILTIEVGALGLGLMSAPLPVGGGAVEQIRRRWMFSLVTFALASAFGATLNFSENLQGTALGQGIGLGFLGALPLFSLGTLLGAMGRPDDLGRVPSTSVGPTAVLGAALGFLMAGTVLLPNGAPHTLYLFCLVILSGGALLQGWVLDARVTVDPLGTVVAGGVTLRVERRMVGSPRTEMNLLFAGDIVRGAEGSGGEAGRAWEAALLEGLARVGIQPESILYLGGGSGTLARLFSQRFPHAGIRVVERREELITLARTHFHQWDGWDQLDLQIRPPLEAVREDPEGFSVVVVDCGVLPALAGMPALGDMEWRALKETLAPGAVLILGGLGYNGGDPEVGTRDAVEHLAIQAREWFAGVSVFRKGRGETDTELLQGVSESSRFLILLSADETPAWPSTFGGYSLVPRGGA